ncbi:MULTISPECIES: hypothetical protein [unclassified Facklamia]|uniref:hypothetical protein n=1 Tax=Aerococcaceae TaxID=186827 RepID=UPI0013BC9C75|nr:MULTISPECIES: hypothetical protein [unclassified Facklamia]NEW64019.1 hypothetical protein [Facklamia sp. 252]NEW68810.1 hypothetical protein [Facklamia sp. 253]QQD65363.1 hypothetical protein JDW14_08710 [Aerococcaceae bacterium zg-252]
MKKCKLLYSDSLLGINEEIAEFKATSEVSPYHVDKVRHDNGHYSALVWYRVDETKGVAKCDALNR